MFEHGKGGKGLRKGLSMYLVLQTRHIMAKNTIRNSMYFFAVIFFARIEFGYFVCSYKISLRSILQTTHSENQILYLRKKTHSSNLHTIAESIIVIYDTRDKAVV